MSADEFPAGAGHIIRRSRGRPKSPRTIAAEAAGMSRRQVRTAMAVAAVPEEQFERLVESAQPPTVTALAALGSPVTKPHPEALGPGFGPWRANLPEDERVARCRELRALAFVLLGEHHVLTEALLAAEDNPRAAAAALDRLEEMPALRRRRLLATYAYLRRPR